MYLCVYFFLKQESRNVIKKKQQILHGEGVLCQSLPSVLTEMISFESPQYFFYFYQPDSPLHDYCRSVIQQIGRNVCVFTFGFGTDHDADMLRSIADAGNGLYYFLDDVDSIPESFCDCLGGLLSVAAQVKRDIVAGFLTRTFERGGGGGGIDY